MDKITVGFVRNTQGLKGELKFELLTDFPERFEEEITYFLGHEEIPVTVESYRIYKDNVIIKFYEFDFIDEVEDFKGQYLTIDKKDRFPLDEGEYYIDDLLGFDILYDGKKLGQISNVNTDHAQTIVTGKREDGISFYFPGVKSFVKKVDLEKEEFHLQSDEGIFYED